MRRCGKHLAFLDDAAARAATTCERALLNKLGGGCQVPIGAFAEMKDGELHLTAIVAQPTASVILREQQSGSDPWRWANKSARFCCVAARPRFWKMCMARSGGAATTVASGQ